jgi:hypothetical protein
MTKRELLRRYRAWLKHIKLNNPDVASDVDKYLNDST